jgi:hypothetical protein
MTIVELAKLESFEGNTTENLRYIENKKFNSFRIVNESMAMVELARTPFVNKNNVLVQAAVLDMSTALIYKVVNAFIDRFGDKFKLLYIDTDGFKMSLKTENVYADLSSVRVDNEPIVDMSFLPTTHEYYSTEIARATREADFGSRSRLYIRVCRPKEKNLRIKARKPRG